MSYFGKGPEKNSTILLPLPIDLFTPIGQRSRGAKSPRAGEDEISSEDQMQEGRPPEGTAP